MYVIVVVVELLLLGVGFACRGKCIAAASTQISLGLRSGSSEYNQSSNPSRSGWPT